jgi:thiazole synthase
MALAFKNAVVAGRQSYCSGRISKTLMGNPSSPTEGII